MPAIVPATGTTLYVVQFRENTPAIFYVIMQCGDQEFRLVNEGVSTAVFNQLVDLL